MASTETDFKKWLTLIDNDEAAEIEELYYVVKNVDANNTHFGCERLNDGRYLVTCKYIDEKLLLLSDKAVGYFLSYLESTYGDGDVEANSSFHRALNKKDEYED